VSGLESQFAIARIKLDQSRYKKGYMYISTVTGSNKEKALDFRYFVDDDEIFTPTRIGFRVSEDCLSGCLCKFLKDYKEIYAICCVSKTQSLRIRHLNDQYGESVDVRYYLTTDTYDGWGNKGIRLTIKNYIELQNHIRIFLDEGLNTVNYKDLFHDKIISSKPSKKAPKIKQNKKKSSSKKATQGKYIARGLEDIISGDRGS